MLSARARAVACQTDENRAACTAHSDSKQDPSPGHDGQPLRYLAKQLQALGIDFVLRCGSDDAAVRSCNIALSRAVKRTGETGWLISLRTIREMRDGLLRPDVVTHNIAVTASERASAWVVAVDVLQTLSCSAVQPSKMTRGAVLNGFSQADKWMVTTGLLGHWLESRFDVDVHAHGAAIASCVAGGMWLAATAVLRGCRVVAGFRDIVACNAAVSACGQAAEWLAALEVMEEAVIVSAEPDVITYNAGIASLATKGSGKRWDPTRCHILQFGDDCV
eukprot:TRINITY_DN104809_c0_g1_i1.p1 TRINITY_DN104809_c0_g1~~TRINITY_DN104809_c0_g1_i1.p1  ORF type:complete len:277 (+),score=23.07 TRINITY_DN104809_c0_g1_i1:215-1045(+)